MTHTKYIGFEMFDKYLTMGDAKDEMLEIERILPEWSKNLDQHMQKVVEDGEAYLKVGINPAKDAAIPLSVECLDVRQVRNRG